MTALREVSFELFLKWAKEKGVTDRGWAREILCGLIKLGLVEGDDEVGYILTEKGVNEAKVFDRMGVV